MSGPLAGLRVVELAHEHVAWAGKLVADLGADVVVVEPPGGSDQRRRGPFLDDEPGPERSLWWWHYHTSKYGVVADLDGDRDRLARLVAEADLFLEGERPGRLAEARPGLGPGVGGQPPPDHGVDLALRAGVAPIGRARDRPDPDGRGRPGLELRLRRPPAAPGPRRREPGFPDSRQLGHDVAAGRPAAIGRAPASANTSTSACSRPTMSRPRWPPTGGWPARRRCAGRPAGTPPPGRPSPPRSAVETAATPHSGVPPSTPQAFARVLDLLDRLGLRDQFPMTFMLELGAQRERFSFADIPTDPMVAEIFVAARDVITFLAEHLDAYDFFFQTQTHRDRHRSHLYPGGGHARSQCGGPGLPDRGRAPRAGPNVRLSGPYVPVWCHAVGDPAGPHPGRASGSAGLIMRRPPTPRAKRQGRRRR